MGICIIYNCDKPTDGDRLLCTRHAARGLMERADGKCQNCRRNSANPPGLLCVDCEAARKGIINATANT